MDIQEILVEFEHNNGYFPREAVEAAIASRDAITPELLRIIEHTTKNADELEKDGEWMSHLYAIFLLAQFREQRAYPLIVDFFSLPRKQTYNLTGDVVSMSLGQILASVCGGDTGLIKSLIEDKEINGFVRGAALRSLVCLVAAGEKSVDEVSAYFHVLFNGGLEREFSQIWNSLVADTARLCSNEMRADIEKTFEDNLIEPFYVDIETATKMLDEDHEKKLQTLRKDPRFKLIEDTVGEMQAWSCFNPEQSIPSKSSATSLKIGRNDPCPCGSGKKYKKCCLRG